MSSLESRIGTGAFDFLIIDGVLNNEQTALKICIESLGSYARSEINRYKHLSSHPQDIRLCNNHNTIVDDSLSDYLWLHRKRQYQTRLPDRRFFQKTQSCHKYRNLASPIIVRLPELITMPRVGDKGLEV